MASGSLAYRPHQDLDTDLTKFGFLVYAGTVRDFHEWEFRAMTRWKQTKVEERSDLASKFLDSLRSEAYIVAEDLGTDVLFSSQNTPKVIEAVRERLFPLAEQETKELYRLGTQVGGTLSRQPGEPMISYIDRRKRWLRKLQQLDKALHISEAVLTDLLLDNSGLTRQERLMVLTSMSGSTATKDAEASLIRMHSRIHTLERKQPSAKGGTGKGKGFPRKGDRGKGKGYGKRSQKRTAYTYLSAVEDLFEYPDADEDDDGTAYLAGQEGQDGQDGEGQDWAYHGEELPVYDREEDTACVAQSADASLRDVELDVFTAFISAGFDEEDKEALAFLADTVQCETVAFMARAKAKGKGKSVMQRSAHGYRPRSTGLTVEDRRRKLHEIKLRSTCKTCGRKGHWAGDKECPGPGKGAGKPAVAHLAQVRRVMDKSTQTCDFSASPSESDSESHSFDPEPTANYVSLGQDSETEPAAYMGFFDKTDFEESDEELLDDFASQGAPSTEWDTIEYPDGSDQVFRFGMHRGSTYLEVLQNHPDYYHWGLKEKEPSTMLEAWLVWVYRNFEVPPVGGGRATLRAVTLPVEADSLQKARKEVSLEKAPKSKLGLLKADPKGPCVGGCPAHALNKAGSNAHVIKTTCMLCGTRTSNPRPKAVPKNDPRTCEHKRTDNRNSTRSVHRTFCLDCCTVVEEIPQKLFKEQKGLAEQVQQSPLKVQNLTRRQLEEYNFTKFEAGEVVKKFFKHMDKFLLKVDQVSSTELSSCLEDAMDQVVEQTKLRMQHGRAADVARSSQEVEPPPLPAFSPVRRERRSAQPREQASPAAAAAAGPRERGAAVSDAMAASPPSGKGSGSREKFAGVATAERKGDPGEDTKLTLTALVGQLQKDDLEGDISPKSVQSSDSEPAPLDEEIAEPQLQLVDPLEDHENVWVMLDEGCNQTCHGTKWRAHSSKVLAKFGLQFTSVRSSGTSFKGIGAARATGKFAMPFALRIMPESGGLRRSTRLQGELSSVELDSPDVLCLLSLQDQVQLGLIKDLRRGECRISGYAGTLQLARHSKTGLLLLCVSQFGANVTERHRKFAVNPEVIPKRTSKKEKNTFSIPLRDGTARKKETLIPSGDKDSTAYMLSEMVKETEGQRKNVLVVTLGLEKLETCQRGRGTYRGLTELIRGMRKGQSHEFSLNNEAHEDTLLESLRQNFESFRDYATEQILFLDCRHMNDPGKDKSLRDHLGTYPRNVQAMVLDPKTNGKWVAFMKEVVPAVHKLIQENEQCVIFMFCKSGRHRSVSNAKIVYDLIKETYEVEARLLHLCDGYNWRYLCGGCAECNWESKEARSTAEKVMDFARERWFEFAAGAGSSSDPPQPDSAVKQEAAQDEQLGDEDHDEDDTTGAAEASASSKAPAQPFTVETPDGVSVPVHDLRPELEGLDDKSLEKVDHTSLTCAVAAKYLDYEAARALLSSLVADVRSGKRTEKEWDTDLELANRSLDQAILQLDEDKAAAQPGATTAGRTTAQAADPPPRERTRSAQADGRGEKGKGEKGKGKGRGDKGRHKRHGEIAFKTWLQPGVGHEGAGPPVRVSYGAHAANSWDKVPTELQRYRKHVAIQWTSDGPWEWRETNVAAHSWVYFGDRWDQHPRHMLVFLVPPRGGSAFYVGGMLPDLMASDLKVMKKETGKMFEDSCKNLNTHDDLLMQALGLPSAAITGDPPTIFALANSEFQPGSLERTGAKVIVRHPGYRMILLEDIGWQKQISKEIAKIRPDLLLLVYSLEDQVGLTLQVQTWLQSLSAYTKEVLVLDSLGSVRWNLWFENSVEGTEREFQLFQCRGDLCVGTFSQAIGEVMSSWANCDHDIHYSPVSIDTVGTQVGFAETLLLVLQEGCVEDHVAEAFPVEARQDEVEESGTLDAIVDPRDNRTAFMDDLELAEEADILDTLPLAGFPKEESERRKAWSKVPRRVRLGIRRLHTMMNHKPKEVLVQVLRGAGASEELVNAAKIFKCESCRVSEEKVRTHPVSAPPPYEFNHTVSVDVLETADSTGAKFSWLNIIDVGTSYQVVTLVRVGGGQPSSAKCLQKFMQHWVSPFGWPKVVSHDRGLHNRGAFAHGLGSHGVQIRQAGLESPEHIGKCERHGGIIKRAFKRLVKDHNVVGKDDVKVAMLEAQVAKNEFMRVGGFSPTQWVLGRLPRGVGHVLDEEELGQLGVLSGRLDATTAFGRQAEFRHTARKAFVHEDCSRRVRKTVLRKAAPLPGKYQAGDLVCYRIARDEHSGISTWSTVSKIIGFDNKTVWVVHQGVPVATSLARLRPCTSAEVLAFQVLNRGNIQYEHAEVEREQQRYIDATGDDLVLDNPEEPPDGGIGIGSPIQADTEADPPETAAAAPERAVRRRVGATREESRAVTVEEPENEQVDPPGGIQEPMAEDTAVDADGEAEATEGSSALLLRAYASHFWTKEERTVWNSLPGEKEYEALRVFFADRVEDDKKVTQWRKRRKNFTSKKQKEKHGKILMYHKCPEDVQKELDKSRAKEWAKWQDFSAAIILDDAQYDELIREGHQVIPTQWVELDKNHNKRLLDPTVEANYKSRLVVRGDLEKGDPRSDSPTASIEAQNLVFSFSASRKVKIKSLDVTNAYFQGEEIDRVLLLSQPKGGLPGLKPHQHMLARAPIYGSTDGGRRFWKRLRNYLKGKGLRENRIYRALYSYTDADGVVQLLLTSHVDDLLWACDPSCDWIMNDLIETFKCGKVETGSFRYCGKEISQDEDFNIHVTCSETTRNVNKIHVDKRRHPGDPLTDSDKTQMKSVAGSLAWVCRQCRPDLSYRVSKIQSASSNGTVADIRDANKAVEHAISTYDRGLVFKSGLLDWKTPGALLSLVITDASHANESEEMIINEMTSVEGHRSQGARMVFLTDGALWKGNKGSIHPILWASNLVRRVCRSTIQAEAYTLQAGVEDGDVLRAAVTDIFGCLDMKRWEATSAKFVKQIWMTDCKSLELTLSNPKCNKHSDKRLSIEIASLRQELWRKAGEKAGYPFYDDYKPADDQLTDIVRWIDTDVMIADPLTKVMEPVKLVEALKTNTLDVEQPLESVVKKRAKQLQRRSTKKEEDNEQDR
ncbi:GIP [Symbiodinium sp. CCMP2592]|nr:GIP [Symbiodinium sp. CCMP2592]